jgi:5-methyltetrahydrofolate--homocysteine methyltransferase
MGLRPGLCTDIWCLEALWRLPRYTAATSKRALRSSSTNTFGATSLRLAHFGLQDRVRDINVAAVRIAREVAGGKALVAGCIGPLGSLVEPLGEVTFDQAYDAFAAQVDALIEGGPDLLVIDTIADLNEMRAAILACKDRAPDVPLIAHMTLDPRGRSFTGTSPEVAGVVMQSMGADAVGFNCSVGPDLLVDAVKRLAAVARVPVSVQPNAGLPRLGTDGRTMFPMGPEEFASYGPRLVAAGASVWAGAAAPHRSIYASYAGRYLGLHPARAWRRVPSPAAPDRQSFPEHLLARLAGSSVSPPARKLCLRWRRTSPC